MSEQTVSGIEITTATENRYVQYEGPWNDHRIHAQALAQAVELSKGADAFTEAKVMKLAGLFDHFIRTGETALPADPLADCAVQMASPDRPAAEPAPVRIDSLFGPIKQQDISVVHPDWNDGKPVLLAEIHARLDGRIEVAYSIPGSSAYLDATVPADTLVATVSADTLVTPLPPA